MSIIGRHTEQEYLKSLLESDKAEFIMVYGRRRVGKTFLIRQFFQDKFCFRITEVKEFLHSKHIFGDNQTIAECYMAMGGIPYYLNFLTPEKSLAQNLDAMFFNESPLLEGEFHNLYASLFLHSNEYIDIIEVLSKKKLGYSRDEIINALGRKDGGSLTRKQTELEQCGFIRKYMACNRVSTLYQLIDFFSIFYFQFLRHGSDYDNDIWMHLSRTNTYTTWRGLGFERLCLAHSQKIKTILGISGVSTKTYSVFHPSSQIDMVIERGDNVVNLFEMKFTAEPYALEKKSAENLANKISVLREQLKKRQSIMTVLVTNQPAKRNEYFTQYIQKNIVLDEIVE